MTGIGNLQTVFGAGQTQQTDSVGENQSTSANNALLAPNLPGKQDQSVVSSTAGALKEGLDTDDVRMDKVSQLQAAINNGSYSVSSADVAGKLITSMLDGN